LSEITIKLQSKKELRRQLLKSRQEMSAPEWQEKSESICKHIQSSVLFAEANTILAFFSFRQEPNLSLLFEKPRRWGFPRCVGESLSWHVWQPGEVLETNGFGIKEPSAEAAGLSVAEVDLILVPAVACDGRGYRLGYGGGFYDRLFALPQWRGVPAVGIVFESAFLPLVPVDEWDCRLNAVCTEVGLRLF
jgi:5-formyltetrahydrofolate cyclo-ligase